MVWENSCKFSFKCPMMTPWFPHLFQLLPKWTVQCPFNNPTGWANRPWWGQYPEQMLKCIKWTAHVCHSWPSESLHRARSSVNFKSGLSLSTPTAYEHGKWSKAQQTLDGTDWSEASGPELQVWHCSYCGSEIRVLLNVYTILMPFCPCNNSLSVYRLWSYSVTVALEAPSPTPFKSAFCN